MMSQSHIRTICQSFGVALLIFALAGPLVASLRFHLPANDKRCLKEEMRKGATLTGEFELSESPGVRTDLSVSFLQPLP